MRTTKLQRASRKRTIAQQLEISRYEMWEASGRVDAYATQQGRQRYILAEKDLSRTFDASQRQGR